MKNYFKIIYIFLSLFSYSCNNGVKGFDSLKLINIDCIMKSMEKVNLSQFTENIRYVPLENKENIFYDDIKDLDILGNLILVSDMKVCILYDTSGRCISKIGTQGRGPGEYDYATNLELGKNGKIYLQNTYDLLEYNLDGTFITNYKRTFLTKDNYYLSSWLNIDDSLFFGHVPNSTGLTEYKALIVNKLGDTKNSYKNYILFNRGQKVSTNLENRAQIYQFNNKIFYKEYYNDTLFYLNDRYKLIPIYAFNLGKFKEPLSERAKVFPTNRENYIYINEVFQTENYLFFDCLLGSQYPAKRVTAKIIYVPNYGKYSSWYNGRSVLGIFNKVTQELIFCKPTSTDNPLFTSGIYNDIDAGPRFFPQKMVNDSTMVMYTAAKDLKDHVASDDFKKNVAKFPEKKKKLEELANSLTEFDNPILMFVTFKSK
jgi:hypothetical protein